MYSLEKLFIVRNFTIQCVNVLKQGNLFSDWSTLSQDFLLLLGQFLECSHE